MSLVTWPWVRKMDTRFVLAGRNTGDLRTPTSSEFERLRHDMHRGFDRVLAILWGLLVAVGVLIVGVFGLWLKA